MTSKFGKNKQGAHKAQPGVSLLFLPHFDILSKFVGSIIAQACSNMESFNLFYGMEIEAKCPWRSFMTNKNVCRIQLSTQSMIDERVN